jgi:enediyne biosynthesis protein E4
MKNTLYFLFICLIIASCSQDQKTLFQLKHSQNTGITFNNRIVETDSSNILTEEYIFNGGGVAVGDFNNDDRSDLFFAGNQVANKLYLNEGGFKFKDISLEAGIEANDRWNTGVTVVDINADGWLDIYVCSAREPGEKKRENLLFVNQGIDANGVPKFIEMATKYGIAEAGNSMGASFFDYNKDGFLDLYVLNNEQTHTTPTNYRKKIIDGSAVSNDRLYRNNGNGTFTDVTLEAGITIEGFGLGIAIADLNYDGWSDIYITNDYLTNDLLYINNGDGTFSNNIKDLIKHQSQFSMGLDVSDYNNDGYLDIVSLDMLGETNYRMKTTLSNTNYISYVLNERWDYEYQYMRNMLHMGNGPDVPYSEIGLLAGISQTDWSWSPLFMDIDNDGYRDLLITNGFPRDITDRDFGDFRIAVHRFYKPSEILDSIPSIKISNYAFKNNGNSTFKDIGDSWGLDIPSFSNGAAFADLDKDGDLDYVVNNINDEAFIFENTLKNDSQTNTYLNLNLDGTSQNPMGIGAKVVIRYGDDKLQYYEHNLTRGYMSSMEKNIHFGLGSIQKVESLEILWPDGRFERVNNVNTNQTISLAYSDAKPVKTENLSFPFIPKTVKPIFTEVSKSLGIDFIHRERDIVDYNVQRTLPHKLTQNGPCVAVGDINGDSYEDFIIGSSATFSPIVFFQKADGTFTEKELLLKKEDLQFEEESMVLFDLDNDGDLDLYLVSGSNEFAEKGNQYNDRLLVNDGEGNFTFAMDRMPTISSSGSIVKAEDYNNDGYVDLFVGGRTPVAKYPIADRSFLLKNTKGTLEDITDEIAPELRNVGMVTDALWKDLNGDNQTDLIVVGEFMPITIFMNKNNTFIKSDSSGLENYLGWWESIVSADFDLDGDFDLIVGNMGRNNFYQPSENRPVTVLAKDFDNNGSIDPILFAHIASDQKNKEAFPVHFWGDLSKQSTIFRSKFNTYAEYANATQESLLSTEELENTTKVTGNYDQSSYIENLGNGKFKLQPLPIEAQLAPINALVITDFNGDDNPDIMALGNDFGNETFIGRYDALNGILLEGDGKGNFKSIPSVNSGFVVPGDAKSATKINSALGGVIYICTQNRGEILVYKKNK